MHWSWLMVILDSVASHFFDTVGKHPGCSLVANHYYSLITDYFLRSVPSVNPHFSPEIYCNTVSGSICRRCSDNCPQHTVGYVSGICLSHIRQSCCIAGIRRFVTISCEKYGLILPKRFQFSEPCHITDNDTNGMRQDFSCSHSV